MKQRLTVVFLLGILGMFASGATLAFCYWMSPIRAVAWQPPAPPQLSGVLQPNRILATARKYPIHPLSGPEDVDLGPDGWIYGATFEGPVVRIHPDAGTLETFIDTGGRPLGLHFDFDGNLIIADARKGLLSVSREATLTTLATETDGIPYGFTDDLEIGPDGVIYFSDASSKWTLDNYRYELLEGKAWGRLIAYYPDSGTTRTLLSNLHFANGVAIAPDGSFVLVNETWRYRIRRFWLSGPKTGTDEILIDNLPGFPDGVSLSPRGTFWVAIVTPRNHNMDMLHPFPVMKTVFAKLPDLWPQPAHYGLALEIRADGQIVRSLHDPVGDDFAFVTSLQEETNGDLYFGTLHGPEIGRLPAGSW